MKKQIAAFLAAALLLCLFSGCAAPSSSQAQSVSDSAPAASSSDAPESAAAPEPLRIASLKGPTTMGLVKLMRDEETGETARGYTVNMYGTADEIAPQLIAGELDIALVPCNLASVLYNRTEGALQVFAVNTLGVLYIVTTEDGIDSVEDLRGRTVLATGKGTTPEYVLDYILTQNGLVPGEDVTVEYKSEAGEVVAAMQAADGPCVAMLPQPYVTTAAMQMENLKTALDLTAEWDKISPDSSLVTGVAVVRRAFAEEHPEALAQFMEDYAQSTQYVTENVDEAAALCEQYGIVPKAAVAQKALPACNITFLTGAEMQRAVSGYLQVLFDRDPQAVGGALPDGAFYYGA